MRPYGLQPLGSTVHGLSQARILEWVAMPSFRGSSQPRDLTRVSCLAGGFFTTEPPGKPLKYVLANYLLNRESESRSVVSDSFATPWTIQSMEFSRPEYWSGRPFLSPGALPNPGIKPRSPALQADSLPAEPQGKP